MENFELYIPPVTINPVNGQFRKGNIPFNKGLPMKKWMDGRKIKKVMKCLEIGRGIGNHGLAGHNRKKIIAIKDDKIIAFNSSQDAQRILRYRGIKICARNISSVCNKKKVKVGKYSYQRKKAGGYRWFFADDKQLIDIIKAT